jgi:hypothetical protein
MILRVAIKASSPPNMGVRGGGNKHVNVVQIRELYINI